MATRPLSSSLDFPSLRGDGRCREGDRRNRRQPKGGHMGGMTVVRKPDEGEAFWMLNSLYEVRASSDETGGELTAMEVTIPPGMGPPPHIHEGGETVYVIEGNVRYHIAGETHE